MSRIIKFRAWDIDNKVMHFWHKLEDFMVQGRPIFDQEQQGLILMEYTGLKDKNGKEIYEGDLFKETYSVGYSIYEVCFGEYDNGESYEDEISGNGWYLKEHPYWHDYELDIVDFDNNYEVIGNIYENPEILKGTQRK